MTAQRIRGALAVVRAGNRNSDRRTAHVLSDFRHVRVDILRRCLRQLVLPGVPL
jgi:hypothetical protein